MRKIIRFLVATAIGIFLLWIVFRTTNFTELWNAIKTCNLWLFLLCIGTILISFVTRVIRWHFIVNSNDQASFRHLFTSTQIGFLANFLLPGRIGEAVRAGALTKFTQIPLSKSLTYVALDRTTDLLGLLVILIFALIGFHPKQDITLPPEIFNITLPANLIQKAAIITLTIIGLIFGLCIFFYLYSNRFLQHIKIAEKILGERLILFLTHLVKNIREAISMIKDTKAIIGAVFFSCLTWGCFWLSYIFLFKAFNVQYPWYTPPVSIALISFLISVPGAPGFIGQFHVGVMGGLFLTVPNIDINIARAIAILAHGANFLSVVSVGLLCIYIEQFSPITNTPKNK
ncbi:MAG TPA: lysylphosphatidylglycerol synthase transmembrane domain-containing protein [Candidatus Hydrogenedens sp.]|nr:flippase-like domain-containing protein [Candidatus Hydrogenedens sp.]HOK08517.1 lysylphosphatidylglycerol synthase transmembrane domain-containing protein [Candidatus Hydrogenedens sp.]HOL19005.1 lysylphosphatidylglycerol synthase transmembrane domain-containing protein [Candidatus Hydrogenedens sp.]HPP57813.1 lysylphosphatidylglycerol synthase transmembrane domain-containing protein [Candidatus Hydrogenedens sp.]